MKKFKNFILFGMIFFCSYQVYGIFEGFYPSSKSVAMGGASATVNNFAFSTFYNPANISSIKYIWIESSYKEFYNIDSLSFFALSIGSKLNDVIQNLPDLGAFGFSYAKLGDNELENESIFNFGYSTGLSDALFLGISFNFYNLKMLDIDNSYLKRNEFGISFGALANIYEEFRCGFYYKNLNSPVISKDGDLFTELPQKIVIGFSYNPYDDIGTYVDFSKNLDDTVVKVDIHIGQEFGITKFLKLYFGIQTIPALYSAGLSVSYSGVNIFYALFYHSTLSATHQFSIAYNFEYLKQKPVKKEPTIKEKKDFFTLKISLKDENDKFLKGNIKVYLKDTDSLLLEEKIEEEKKDINLFYNYDYDIIFESEGYVPFKKSIISNEIEDFLNLEIKLKKK